jgi:Ser/Thr protein kinase RdoA (MazF antagonist)
MALDLDPDLRDLAAGLGLEIVAIEAIGALTARRARRQALRLTAADGTAVKGRLCDTEADARRFQALRAALPDGLLPRLLGRSGRALLLEWVDGRLLGAHEWTDRRLESAGGILARIHAAPLPPDAPTPPFGSDPAGAVSRLETDLARLVDLGAVDAATGERLAGIAAASAPARIELAIAHWDFCAENFVLPDGGDPVPVDNETLCVAPPAADLARWWYRWELGPDHRARFLRGYRRHRELPDVRPAFPFWLIRALVSSAVFRVTNGYDGAAIPLDRLARIAADGPPDPALP